MLLAKLARRGKSAGAAMRVLAAAAAIGFAPAAVAAPVPPAPHPALWVVGDADTTIYLFGTFHSLSPDTAWFDQRIHAAFDRSQQLVLETLVPARIAPPLPAAPAAEPFMADARRAMSAGHRMGMSTDTGADAVLRRTAELAGKPVSGLESWDWQVGLFRRLSAPHPATAPAAGAVPAVPAAAPGDQAAALMSRLLINWNEGNTDGFAQMLSAIDAQSPDTYRLLFAERNARWAGWIAERLKQPGTVFVAVGSGHLAGKDSVQARLAQLGIGAARVY